MCIGYTCQPCQPLFAQWSTIQCDIMLARCRSLSQLSSNNSWATPRTSRVRVSQCHRQTHHHCYSHRYPTDNLQQPIRLTCTSVDCGRKPEQPQKTHTSLGRTFQLNIAQRPGNQTCNFVSVVQQCHPNS